MLVVGWLSCSITHACTGRTWSKHGAGPVIGCTLPADGPQEHDHGIRHLGRDTHRGMYTRLARGREDRAAGFVAAMEEIGLTLQEGRTVIKEVQRRVVEMQFKVESQLSQPYLNCQAL